MSQVEAVEEIKIPTSRKGREKWGTRGGHVQELSAAKIERKSAKSAKKPLTGTTKRQREGDWLITTTLG